MSEKKISDPGLGEVYEERTQRIINEDGSFNIQRTGIGSHFKHVFQWLINVEWPYFVIIIVTGYIIMNVVFAIIYQFIGIEHISGTDMMHVKSDFLIGLFFSFQTFTTVGYGALAPLSPAANWVASFEALLGFMSFSIATGLIYGRFSRPHARIMYSKNILLSPYQDGQSLMFRIVNMRPNVLMDMEAKVLLTTTVKDDNGFRRSYHNINLALNRIDFFPLNWTIVHPIDESSPFHGKSVSEIVKLNPEILILIKGFDDTFSQTVHSRYSYTLQDIVFNAKFLPAFHTKSDGTTTLDVADIHLYKKLGE